MRISDWSSDVCSSDLQPGHRQAGDPQQGEAEHPGERQAQRRKVGRSGGATGGGGRHEGVLAAGASRRQREGLPGKVDSTAYCPRIAFDRPRGKDRPMLVARRLLALCAGLLLSVPLTVAPGVRSEEHTSELPSLMRLSYAVSCLKK